MGDMGLGVRHDQCSNFPRYVLDEKSDYVAQGQCVAIKQYKVQRGESSSAVPELP